MFRKYILALTVGLLMLSCNKLEDVDAPMDFSVTTQRDTYAVGELVKFNMTGSPDVISFYTGELGHNYDFIGGRIANCKFFIDFESQRLDGTQKDQIRILVSNNFDGTKTLEGVNAPDVTWKDYSDQFAFPEDGDRSPNFPSTSVDITEMIIKDTTEIYVAVKHVVKDQTVYGTGNLNRIKNFTITSKYETISNKIFTYQASDWTLFSTPNKEVDRAEVQPAQIQLRNNYRTTESRQAYTEDWVVAGPIQIIKVMDFGPDRAIGIKGVTDIFQNTYNHTFEYPGAYKVVFRAQNVNIDKQQEKFVTLDINVIK